MEFLKFVTGKKNEEQLIVALNAFGKDGWRLNRLYGATQAMFSWKGGTNLLLEREVEES